MSQEKSNKVVSISTIPQTSPAFAMSIQIEDNNTGRIILERVIGWNVVNEHNKSDLSEYVETVSYPVFKSGEWVRNGEDHFIVYDIDSGDWCSCYDSGIGFRNLIDNLLDGKEIIIENLKEIEELITRLGGDVF